MEFEDYEKLKDHPILGLYYFSKKDFEKMTEETSESQSIEKSNNKQELLKCLMESFIGILEEEHTINKISITMEENGKHIKSVSIKKEK